jgi:DNA-binding transcriptional LysR family regulator
MPLADIAVADLLLFVQAAQTDSIASAARRLAVNKVTATRQLQRLEAIFGCRLLHRSGGHYALTEAGQTLLPMARQVLDDLNHSLALVGRLQTAVHGRLRVFAPHHYASTRLMPLMPVLLARHPQLSIDLCTGSRPPNLQAGEVELAIHMGPVWDDSLIVRELGAEPQVLCASPGYLQTKASLQSAADLARHRLLMQGSAAPVEAIEVNASDDPCALANAVALRAPTYELLVCAALQGAGIALVPHSVVETQLQAGTLRQVLPELSLAPAHYTVVYTEEQRRSSKVRAVVQALVEHLEHGQPPRVASM